MDNLTLLLDEAEAYAAGTGTKLSIVSYKLFGHVDRIADYRAGKHSPSMRTIERGWQRLRDLRAAKRKAGAA
jgi:hypothetical protein